MHIAGDKDVFAIQWDEESWEGDNLYGYLCFWIGGKQVGNYAEISTLSICSSYLQDFLQRKQERQLEGSCAKQKEELFELLYKRFFRSDPAEDSCPSMGEIREIFWLDEIGEYSFRDKLGMILIDEPDCNRQRLIWEWFDNPDVLKEFHIPMNYFDEVAEKFCRNLQS